MKRDRIYVLCDELLSKDTQKIEDTYLRKSIEKHMPKINESMIKATIAGVCLCDHQRREVLFNKIRDLLRFK